MVPDDDDLTWTQRWQRGESIPLHIAQKLEKKRRKQVTQELALPDRQALARYQGIRALKQEQALEILDKIWPEAPQIEKVRAAMLCESYRLNPLMKHVFLIPFEKKNQQGVVVSTSWATVMGIDATRLLASRRAPYSVIDGPRVMTEEEQIKIFGEVDAGSVVAITVVADAAGNRAPGYGKWPRVNRWGKPNEPQGTDKGNSMVNMAMIRSERNALKRLRPAEMPDVEVVDAEYEVLPRLGGDALSEPREAEAVLDVDEETGEVRELEDEPATPTTAADVTNSEPTQEYGPPFANVGEFYEAARQKWNIFASAIRNIPGVPKDIQTRDYEAAWAKVVASQEGT